MNKKHPGVYLRGKVYWIKYSRNGRPFRESSHSEKESDAVRLLNLRRGDIARGVQVTPKLGRVMIDELVEDMKNDLLANGRSTRNLEWRWEIHLKPLFGGRRAASITTADVNRFIVQRQQGKTPEQIRQEVASLNSRHAAAVEKIHQDKAIAKRAILRLVREEVSRARLEASQIRSEKRPENAEINRETQILKRSFSLALQSGKLVAAPHIKTLQENNVRSGFFEQEQFEAVLRHLPEHVSPVARFAFITGWRTLSEILPLQWRQIDFKAGIVTLDPGTTKNKDGRVFPFTAELRALLEEQKTRRKDLLCPWVFTYKGGQFKSYKRAWKTACKKAGLLGKIPHDFRRTAVRNLVRAGIHERVAMQMTGHKTRSVFDRYHIVSPGDLFEAAKRLDEFKGTVAGTVAHDRVQSASG